MFFLCPQIKSHQKLGSLLWLQIIDKVLKQKEIKEEVGYKLAFSNKDKWKYIKLPVASFICHGRIHRNVTKVFYIFHANWTLLLSLQWNCPSCFALALHFSTTLIGWQSLRHLSHRRRQRSGDWNWIASLHYSISGEITHDDKALKGKREAFAGW